MRKGRGMTVAYAAFAVVTRTFAWRSATSLTRRVRRPTSLAPSSLQLLSQQHPQRTSFPAWNTRLFLSSNTEGGYEARKRLFRPGDEIQVEVVSFGPLGASVDVIGKGHDEADLIPETEPPLAEGLILQKEIAYFRQARNNVDVVRGEILLAYVERVREQDGKIDIALRTYGGRAKADEVAKQIMDRLEFEPGGTLPIGDKSPPSAIAQEFPGVSKGTFKKAVAALYRQGKVQPAPDSITLMK